MLLLALAVWWVSKPDVPPPDAPTPPSSGVSVEEGAAFAQAVAQTIRGDAAPDDLPAIPYLRSTARGLAYVALRADGERAADAWGEGGTPVEALSEALVAAGALLDDSARAIVDSVEVAIAGPGAGTADAHAPAGENLDRGILGMSVRLRDGRLVHYAPTEMIADNTSFERVVDRLHAEGLFDAENAGPGSVELFEATQLLVDLDDASVVPLIRGNQVIEAGEVSESSTRELARGMTDWLAKQLAENGRMVYEYFPSRGEESQSNNMIRQWMATLALVRVADERQDDALDRRIQDNFAYNLDLSYREEDGLGLIADPDGDVKLGAVALAALALSQNPDPDGFAEQELALRRMVDHLWQPDGSFETFYLPAGRTGNQNFYPGEALLLWATTLEEQLDPDLLDRFMLSFEFYRTWHREQPNPAFVPWHTMAYTKVWGITHDPALRDFVFEMNDWLLDMQQWDDAPAADVAGRFYDPDRPDYGPPHASSDGVYLEGLIAAYRLAVEVGDDARVDAYRTAIARGIRNLMQLQFADAVDMYYVSQLDRVEGGLRTTVYDNTIRVDNVQHGLLAVMDVLEVFGPTDYRIQGAR
jgi:hypothetical protein